MSSNKHAERIRHYIEENLRTIESPRDVAEALDVPYSTLRKHVRKKMQVPLGTYIRQRRVDRMRDMLVETDRPVYEICRAAGYASDTSGIRAFRRCEGITPAEYRRCYRDGAQ